MPLFLVRHATAGKRDHLNPSDDERPLDTFGIAEAEAIAQRLENEPVEEIYSSPALRCRQTVLPLAERLGLTVTPASELYEGAARSVSSDFVRSFTGRSVVLCSHGDVIPDVLRNLERGGTRLDGRGSAKGSVWLLDNSTERIDYAVYLGRPGTKGESDISTPDNTVADTPPTTRGTAQAI